MEKSEVISRRGDSKKRGRVSDDADSNKEEINALEKMWKKTEEAEQRILMRLEVSDSSSDEAPSVRVKLSDAERWEAALPSYPEGVTGEQVETVMNWYCKFKAKNNLMNVHELLTMSAIRERETKAFEEKE